MKKLVCIAFVLSMAITAHAQVQVALGLKAGANISKFDDDVSENITSVHGGAFALFKLTKIGIQPEVLFSQQGSKLDKIDLKTSYMTIPVMLKVYLVGGLNLQLGPQFGFLTKAELDGDNVKDSFKKSDISANVGLGVDLPFGLTIDGRYNIGLSDLNDNDDVIEGSFKSQVIQLSIGYKILKFGN